MIIYGICLSVGLLQGVMIHNFIITAFVSAALVISMLVFTKTVRTVDSVYSIEAPKMSILVFKSEFDDVPIDEYVSKSPAVKVVLLIAVNALGILVGILGSQLSF
jgi:hypothetical protein